jgi:RNA polymerase sigma-70 factor (ECF subfamily)
LSKRGSKPAAKQNSLAGNACEQYHAELHRFLMRRLRSVQHAQDLAQEAYLRLLRVERTELVRMPRAYLYRIAVNLVSEFRLREQRELITYDSDALEEAAERASDAGPDEQGDKVADAQQIDSVLGRLPPLYLAILVLRKRDGLSYQEIAQQLDVSIHTVKKYLARALAICRQAQGSQ